MRQHSARRAADYDLSVAQVRALYELRDPLSMRELADRLYLDPSNLTALVDRLEDLDLVERTSDAGDRRVKRLVLTAAGVGAVGGDHRRGVRREPRVQGARRGEQAPVCSTCSPASSESPEP